MKLTDQQKDFLKLVDRSSKDDAGWRKVSSMLSRIATQQAQDMPELLEIEQQEVGCRIRLTQKGQQLIDAMKWL